MTADLFFNYVIPVILIVNVIAVISLGVDYFRDRKSNLKKNLDEFKAASPELCDNLERFHDDTKKISAEIFEAVSSNIDGYVRERVEHYIKENLTHPVPKQTPVPDDAATYRKDFLHEPHNQFRARVGKQAAIRESYHQLLSHIVDRGGGNCKSIFGLIDNILTDHFMKNGNTVKEILTNNTDGV